MSGKDDTKIAPTDYFKLKEAWPGLPEVDDTHLAETFDSPEHSVHDHTGKSRNTASIKKIHTRASSAMETKMSKKILPPVKGAPKYWPHTNIREREPSPSATANLPER